MDVVDVVGGTVEVVVVVPACARFEGRTNEAAADVDERDRWPAVWSKLAIWAAATAQTETSNIGTSPTARPRRAGGEGIG
ncbi:MAG TPA: hypothetical protein VHZ05_11645 [Acidimicrobiales bacterium]|nr:hypothetical protein [Acidimicrobiales bacterium]